MSTATCKGTSNAARQPKALSPSRVAPLFHVSGVARRLQTAAGMCTPRALGRRKKSATTRHGWVFQQAPKAATRYTTTKWPSRGMATLLPQLSFTRTGTLCWKIVSLTDQVTPCHAERAQGHAEKHDRRTAVRNSSTSWVEQRNAGESEVALCGNVSSQKIACQDSAHLLRLSKPEYRNGVVRS